MKKIDKDKQQERKYQMGIFSKIKSALQKTSEKISITITGKKIDENLAQEIEDALIKAGFSKVNTNHHETKPWIAVIAEK